MGQACGKRWYYSNIVVGDNDHRPCKHRHQKPVEILSSVLEAKFEAYTSLACTWLNRDASRDGSDMLEHNEAAAIQIHVEVWFAYPLPPDHY